MPRAVSAGIWREVELRTEEKYGFRYLYFQLDKIEETPLQTKGTIRMMFDSYLKPEHIFAPLTYVINGRCGDSEFSYSCPYKGGGGRIIFEIEDMKLWWPRYYGEPNLYDITVQVYDQKGNLVHQKNHRFAEWIEKEAEWVVKELRDHPSLALWSGDNEIDRVSGYVGADPSKNYISREILPRKNINNGFPSWNV